MSDSMSSPTIAACAASTSRSAGTCSKRRRAGLPTTQAWRLSANSIAATKRPDVEDRPSAWIQ